MASDEEVREAVPPQPMLTVAAVARRLGVAPSTLRTWDRRYGLGPSAHTAGSHRRYSSSDLDRLITMRGLTIEGVPPAEAAQIALTSRGRGAPSPAARPGVGPGTASPARSPTPVATGPTQPDLPPGLASSGSPSTTPSATVTGGVAETSRHAGVAGWASPGGLDADAAWIDPADQLLGPRPGDAPAAVPPIPAARAARWRIAQRSDLDLPPAPSRHMTGYLHRGPADISAPAGGGRVMALPEGSPQARGLARAAMSLDTPEVTRLLRESLAWHGVAVTWESLVLPVLQAIGERWRLTGDGVDVEHAFSETVTGVLRGVTVGVRGPRNTCSILLTCSEGDQHTLPLYVLAAALAEEDVSCRMLGAGMPADALVSAVRRTGPAVVFVYARLPVTQVDVLVDLPRQRPAPRVVVGGTGWTTARLPGSVDHVDSLSRAVEAVLAAAHV